MSPTTLSYERPLPSPGLTVNQLQAVFAATGQPALFYGLSQMPRVRGVKDPAPTFLPGGKVMRHPGYWDTRLFSVLCRYLNSGFPVLVATLDHAFVIVGWFREGRRIRFVACDDQWGPYETITSPFTDRRAPWNAFMVPLPPKVYLSGEQAENVAFVYVQALQNLPGAPPSWGELAASLAAGDVSLRTFLRSNLQYKAVVSKQGRGESAVRLLRLARMPHWVWVVEAQVSADRVAGRPSVAAEIVFDSTSSDQRPALVALSFPGLSRTFPTDDGSPQNVSGAAAPWRSHREFSLERLASAS